MTRLTIDWSDYEEERRHAPTRVSLATGAGSLASVPLRALAATGLGGAAAATGLPLAGMAGLPHMESGMAATGGVVGIAGGGAGLIGGLLGRIWGARAADRPAADSPGKTLWTSARLDTSGPRALAKQSKSLSDRDDHSSIAGTLATYVEALARDLLWTDSEALRPALLQHDDRNFLPKLFAKDQAPTLGGLAMWLRACERALEAGDEAATLHLSTRIADPVQTLARPHLSRLLFILREPRNALHHGRPLKKATVDGLITEVVGCRRFDHWWRRGVPKPTPVARLLAARALLLD